MYSGTYPLLTSQLTLNKGYLVFYLFSSHWQTCSHGPERSVPRSCNQLWMALQASVDWTKFFYSINSQLLWIDPTCTAYQALMKKYGFSTHRPQTSFHIFSYCNDSECISHLLSLFIYLDRKGWGIFFLCIFWCIPFILFELKSGKRQNFSQHSDSK